MLHSEQRHGRTNDPQAEHRRHTLKDYESSIGLHREGDASALAYASGTGQHQLGK